MNTTLSTRRPHFGPSALMTPANALSVARIVATPVIVVLIALRGAAVVTLVVWLVLATTDWVDGWVARRQGTTRSGAFLDPLADKVLVLGALVTLAGVGEVSWIPVGLIAVREAAVSGYRTLAGRRGVSVPASVPAKVKALSQDLAITLAVIPVIAHHHLTVVSVSMWVAAGLTVATGLHYAWTLSRRRDARNDR